MSARGIRETLGFVGVMVSMAFVGLEIRQNNRLAQAAAYQEIGFATAQNWFGLSQSPDLEFNRIVLQHFSADSAWWADQDAQDVERLILSTTGALRQLETIYLQVELGLLDRVALDRLGWGGFRDLPVLHHLWPWVSSGLDPAFAEYVTEHWADVPLPADWPFPSRRP